MSPSSVPTGPENPLSSRRSRASAYPLRKNGESQLRILGQETWNIFDLRALLGIVSSDLMQACTREFTARQIVLSGFFSSVGIWPNHEVTPQMERKTSEVLKLLEIEHLADREVDEMSSGEARRVLIGRALVHEPRALILDEPTTSLDFHALHELRTLMRKIAQSGTSIILVTPHLPDIIPEIGRVILIHKGRVMEDGPKERVLTAQSLSRLFHSPFEVQERGGYYHLW